MTAQKRKKTDTPEELGSDVGSRLKRRRTLRGQSIEAVHQHTRIPREHLEALEKNDFGHFPAAVYMKGFLRSYCEYLDLDGEELVKIAAADSGDPATGGFPTERPAASSSGPILLPISVSTLVPILLIGGLAAAGGILWSLKTRSPKPEKAIPAVPKTAKAAAEISIELSALATATLELTAQGEAVFEGRLPEGQTAKFQGRDFALKSPHPERMSLRIDGSAVPWTSLSASENGWIPLPPRTK
jgi:cytoskeletal protein RodZ